MSRGSGRPTLKVASLQMDGSVGDVVFEASLVIMRELVRVEMMTTNVYPISIWLAFNNIVCKDV